MRGSLNQELPLFVDHLETVATRRPPAHAAKSFWRSLAYLDLLKSQIRQLEGPGADARAQAAVASYEHGLVLAREPGLEPARQHLAAVDADVAGYPAGLREFVAVFGLSAWAYYYYKAQQWGSAQAALTQVLRTSAALERRGYYALSSRRRITLINLAQVLYKQGKQAAGDALMGAAVRFFHSGHARGLVIADWDEKSFARIPALREYDFQSLVRGIVRRNTEQLGDPAHGNAYYVAVFYRELLASLAVTNYARQALHEWLRVKVTCPENEPQAFLTGVLSFLTRPAINQYGQALELNLLAHVQQLIDAAPGLENRAELRRRVSAVAARLGPSTDLAAA